MRLRLNSVFLILRMRIHWNHLGFSPLVICLAGDSILLCRSEYSDSCPNFENMSSFNFDSSVVPLQFCPRTGFHCTLRRPATAISGYANGATGSLETCCLRLSRSTLRFRAGQLRCSDANRILYRKLFIEYSNRCRSVFSERQICHNCNEHLQ